MTAEERKIWLGVSVFLLLSVAFLMGYLLGQAPWLQPIKASLIHLARDG